MFHDLSIGSFLDSVHCLIFLMEHNVRGVGFASIPMHAVPNQLVALERVNPNQ